MSGGGAENERRRVGNAATRLTATQDATRA